MINIQPELFVASIQKNEFELSVNENIFFITNINEHSLTLL